MNQGEPLSDLSVKTVDEDYDEQFYHYSDDGEEPEYMQFTKEQPIKSQNHAVKHMVSEDYYYYDEPVTPYRTSPTQKPPQPSKSAPLRIFDYEYYDDDTLSRRTIQTGPNYPGKTTKNVLPKPKPRRTKPTNQPRSRHRSKPSFSTTFLPPQMAAGTRLLYSYARPPSPLFKRPKTKKVQSVIPWWSNWSKKIVKSFKKPPYQVENNNRRQMNDDNKEIQHSKPRMRNVGQNHRLKSQKKRRRRPRNNRRMELGGDTKPSSTAVRQLSKRLGLPYIPSRQQSESNRKQAFEASFIKGPKRKVNRKPNKSDKRIKKKSRKQHKKFKNGQLQKLIQNVFQDLNEMDDLAEKDLKIVEHPMGTEDFPGPTVGFILTPPGTKNNAQNDDVVVGAVQNPTSVDLNMNEDSQEGLMEPVKNSWRNKLHLAKLAAWMKTTAEMEAVNLAEDILVKQVEMKPKVNPTKMPKMPFLSMMTKMPQMGQNSMNQNSIDSMEHNYGSMMPQVPKMTQRPKVKRPAQMITKKPPITKRPNIQNIDLKGIEEEMQILEGNLEDIMKRIEATEGELKSGSFDFFPSDDKPLMGQILGQMPMGQEDNPLKKTPVKKRPVNKMKEKVKGQKTRMRNVGQNSMGQNTMGQNSMKQNSVGQNSMMNDKEIVRNMAKNILKNQMGTKLLGKNGLKVEEQITIDEGFTKLQNGTLPMMNIDGMDFFDEYDDFYDNDFPLVDDAIIPYQEDDWVYDDLGSSIQAEPPKDSHDIKHHHHNGIVIHDGSNLDPYAPFHPYPVHRGKFESKRIFPQLLPAKHSRKPPHLIPKPLPPPVPHYVKPTTSSFVEHHAAEFEHGNTLNLGQIHGPQPTAQVHPTSFSVAHHGSIGLQKTPGTTTSTTEITLIPTSTASPYTYSTYGSTLEPQVTVHSIQIEHNGHPVHPGPTLHPIHPVHPQPSLDLGLVPPVHSLPPVHSEPPVHPDVPHQQPLHAELHLNHDPSHPDAIHIFPPPATTIPPHTPHRPNFHFDSTHPTSTTSTTTTTSPTFFTEHPPVHPTVVPYSPTFHYDSTHPPTSASTPGVHLEPFAQSMHPGQYDPIVHSLQPVQALHPSTSPPTLTPTQIVVHSTTTQQPLVLLLPKKKDGSLKSQASTLVEDSRPYSFSSIFLPRLPQSQRKQDIDHG